MHLSEKLIYIFDDRGSWACLERSTGTHTGQGRLPFRGKPTAIWRGQSGWAITESRHKIHLLSQEFELLTTIDTPGPVVMLSKLEQNGIGLAGDMMGNQTQFMSDQSTEYGCI